MPAGSTCRGSRASASTSWRSTSGRWTTSVGGTRESVNLHLTVARLDELTPTVVHDSDLRGEVEMLRNVFLVVALVAGAIIGYFAGSFSEGEAKQALKM